MIGKSIEFHVPLWTVTLDVREAFDRIEFSVIFAALQEQLVSESYVSLLATLYHNQGGTTNGSKIGRGVKQGDSQRSKVKGQRSDRARKRGPQTNTG